MPIRKRGDRFQVRVQSNGRRAEKSLPKGAKRSDAVALEIALRKSVIDQTVGRPQRYTISQALDRWEESEARALRSWERDVRYRAAVVRQLAGDRQLDELPDLVDEIKVGPSRAVSVRPARIGISQLCDASEKWHWTDKPLGRQIERVPGERTRNLRLTSGQVHALMTRADPRLRDLVEFLALTGLRRSEALRLVPDDIRGGSIYVSELSKSGRARIVPLAPAALRIARRAIPFDLRTSSISKLWREARSAAGLPRARLHDLRHAFASWIMEQGTPATVVRDMLGHSSLAVTSRYTHSRPGDAAAAVKNLRVGRGSGKTAKSVSR
jgi:integrase